jgi:uncharacterized cupredoxin-like copper-binding protein/plastocyanin
MRTSRSLALLSAAVAAVLGLAACGSDDGEAGTPAAAESGSGLTTGTDVEVQELEVVVPGGDAGEYALQADTEGLTVGPVEITLTNHGTLEHQAMVFRFEEGADLAAFGAAAASDPSGVSALALVEGFGGPNAVPPGGSRSTTQILEPGDYVLICVLPGEDGAPHAAHGMVLPFTVAPGDAEVGADTPTGVDADAEVRLVDFGFGGDTTFGAGETIHVVNDGEQAHELVAYRLTDDADADAFTAAIMGEAGPPPGVPGTGIGALAPGRSADLTLPDEPGRYVLFCMLPDTARDALPHIAHGMAADATVD